MHGQQFRVDPFFIARYPVTYAQYQAFVEVEDGFANPIWWQRMTDAYQRQPVAEQRAKFANNPRDTISWYQSVAFARWLNWQLQGLDLPHPDGNGRWRVGEDAEIRLPAEWEWQWAAQNGAETRTYPWGEEQKGYANTAETELRQAMAVGMYPQGAAACGALDMVGNLMEWCANDKETLALAGAGTGAAKALRGGDWGYGQEIATCTYCDGEDPGRLDPLNGFRLVLAKDWGSSASRSPLKSYR